MLLLIYIPIRILCALFSSVITPKRFKSPYSWFNFPLTQPQVTNQRKIFCRFYLSLSLIIYASPLCPKAGLVFRPYAQWSDGLICTTLGQDFLVVRVWVFWIRSPSPFPAIKLGHDVRGECSTKAMGIGNKISNFLVIWYLIQFSHGEQT